MRRILLAIISAGTLAGCLYRPAVTAPRYVAQCPAGYRFDGHDCHRVYPYGVYGYRGYYGGYR